MFKNLTVAKRLAFGFGSTIALGVAIVAYAAIAMSGLSADVGRLAAVHMLNIDGLSKVKVDSPHTTVLYQGVEVF
ncbi:hypothetical protein LMG26684_04832 [Achromobacter mucicolens]|nr:hypothetical protein LMG26684_04832 [Achromobacter mucicolens]